MNWGRIVGLCAIVGSVVGCGGSESTDQTQSTEPAETPSTEPQPTEPLVTEPPVTEPPVTEPPVTEPPVTEAPTTEPVAPVVRDFDAIDPIVSAYLDEQAMNGAGLLVVDRDDGVVYEQYWGEFGPERVSLIASSSKMISAGVLLRLDDDGLIDIDAPVSDYVDWGAGNPEVTVAQLLSNSSGLVGLFPEPAFGPYICQYLAAGDIEDCGAQIFETPDDDGDVIAPDTEFRYGGAQWQVAGAVAEAVSGRTWADLVDEIYVTPCGVTSLAYNNHFGQIGSGFDYPVEFNGDPSTLQATENPNIEGGVYINPGDYAALLLMHLRGGTCGDEQVLSQDALDTMHADRLSEFGNDASDPQTGYGMGWWVDRETGRRSDAGAYGSVPWLDLDDGYGAYLIVEANTSLGGGLAGQLYDVVEAAMTST